MDRVGQGSRKVTDQAGQPRVASVLADPADNRAANDDGVRNGCNGSSLGCVGDAEPNRDWQ